LTAYGVFIGIREAVRHRIQSDLPGIRVAIQGVGNVGYHLTKLLIYAGAKVTVADINRQNLERVSKIRGVNVVSVDEILSAKVDVLAPCAMGGAINENSIYNIRAGIVAGAANNQLTSNEMADELLNRGILYAPDYVINAGGIIDVYYQNCGEHSEGIVSKHIDRIGPTLRAIFSSSGSRRLSTNAVADEMAEKMLDCIDHYMGDRYFKPYF
jgi:leucine dehydrogenase